MWSRGGKAKPAISKVYSSTIQNCKVCKIQPHYINKCPDFLALPVTTRRERARELNWCLNCLGSGHSSKKCPSKWVCRQCQQRHHSLMHFDTGVIEISVEPLPFTYSATHISTPQTILNTRMQSTVLISTVMLNNLDSSGIEHQARILLDSGTQYNFIAGELAQRLRLSRKLVNDANDSPALGPQRSSFWGTLPLLLCSRHTID